VVAADDENPVGALAADGGDPSLCDRVHPWCLRRGEHHVEADRGEHHIEGGGELGVWIADQVGEAVSCAFDTDQDGNQRLLAAGRQHLQRVWAVEGCQVIGRHLAQRLVAGGETVVDVQAKPSARARVFATGQGRKTDPVDAHSVAVVALRANGLRHVQIDDETVALRMLVDHRDGLGHARTQTVKAAPPAAGTTSRWGKRFLSAAQARACWRGCGRGMSWAAPAGDWPRTWSPNWAGSTSGSKPPTPSCAGWSPPAATL
jgi:hypothetical protein